MLFNFVQDLFLKHALGLFQNFGLFGPIVRSYKMQQINVISSVLALEAAFPAFFLHPVPLHTL